MAPLKTSFKLALRLDYLHLGFMLLISGYYRILWDQASYDRWPRSSRTIWLVDDKSVEHCLLVWPQAFLVYHINHLLIDVMIHRRRACSFEKKRAREQVGFCILQASSCSLYYRNILTTSGWVRLTVMNDSKPWLKNVGNYYFLCINWKHDASISMPNT